MEQEVDLEEGIEKSQKDKDEEIYEILSSSSVLFDNVDVCLRKIRVLSKCVSIPRQCISPTRSDLLLLVTGHHGYFHRQRYNKSHRQRCNNSLNCLYCPPFYRDKEKRN